MSATRQPFQFVTASYFVRVENQKANTLANLIDGLGHASDAAIFLAHVPEPGPMPLSHGRLPCAFRPRPTYRVSPLFRASPPGARPHYQAARGIPRSAAVMVAKPGGLPYLIVVVVRLTGDGGPAIPVPYGRG